MAAADDRLLDAARGRFAAITDDGELARVASELFGVAGLLDGEPRLRRALSDPDLPVAARKALVADLFAAQLLPPTVEVLGMLVELTRVLARQVPDAVVELAAEAQVTRADRAGTLSRLLDDLLASAEVLESSPPLRWALAEAALDAQAAAALLADVFGGKVDALALEVLEGAVQARRGLELDRIAREVADRAAQRRQRAIAEVRTAVVLDERRQDQLAAALTRTVGRDVELRCLVDPAVIGSVWVKVGDDVIDGSVRHQLELARASLRTTAGTAGP